MPALPAGTPLALGGDWNCVAGDQDLVGGQPGTRQSGFHSGLLPLQQALGLLDAFRHLHPQASEFTHTATSGSSSARIDRWLVSDSLVSVVSATTVSDFQPADHYGVTLSLSPAAAPPRGPGMWSMPPFFISHPAFKALMTAQVRWDQLKVHIQDVARHFSSTLHAERTTQLRALKVRASIARAAYLTDPANQQALQQLRDTSATLQQHRWKVFQNHHLGLAPQLQCLAYGASILFSTVSTQSLHLPARLNGYVTAFRALQPHRLLPVSAMHAEDVLNEPLVFNRQITMPINASAGSTTQKPLMAQEHTILLTAGITKVAHVQAALQLHQPQALTACLQTVLLAMPAAWQTVASSAPAPATWQQGLSASGNQLIQNAQTGQLHAISPSQLWLPAQLQPVTALCPVQVTPWDPSRPWRGPTAQLGSSAQSSNPLFTHGPIWGPHHLSLGVWGWGQQPAHQLVVRQVSQRLRLIKAFGGKHPLATSGLTCPPRVLPRLGSIHTPTQALQEMESRWTASIQADPTGRVRRRSDIPDSQPAWMSPSSGPRLQWSQRQQQQQEQHQQQQQQLQHAQQLPSDKAAINDTLDVLEVCGSHPQQSEWRRLWELASSRYFDRQHRSCGGSFCMAT